VQLEEGRADPEGGVTMERIESLRAAMPEAARDIKLNLQNVLASGAPLTDDQRWGVAIASAYAARSPRLTEALLADAQARVGANVVEDARAAAALMAMNNVFYRFRHLVEKPEYEKRPARLRMNRIAQPLMSKVDFELLCLAVSAISGCGVCVRAHEKTVREGGLTEDHVHEAVRIASVMHASAVALEMAHTSAT
jgi:alkyl hydroperoxide reductase subunit D